MYTRNLPSRGNSLTEDFATALAFLNLETESSASRLAVIGEPTSKDETLHIDSFPDELIVQIFFSALLARKLDRYKQEDRFVDTDPFHLASLRLVCQRWNQVALHTPQLWRGLELNLSKWNPTQSFLEFANMWFNRAGHVTPSLRLTVKMDGSPAREFSLRTSISKQLLSLILYSGRRWGEWQLSGISVNLLLSYPNNWSAPGSRESTPRHELCKAPTVLRVLSIYVSTSFCFNLFATPDPLPSLESLYITGVAAGPGSISYYPQRLRFLHLYGGIYFSPHNFPKFSSLEELTFECGALSSDLLEDFLGPTTLPHLQRLVIIEANSLSLIETILTVFRAPALQLLRFSGRSLWLQIIGGQCIEAFFEESNPTDLTLSLEDSGLSSLKILEFLSRIPPGTLQHLHLDNATDLIGSSPINHLQPLLNTLQTIVFWKFTFRRFTLASLLVSGLPSINLGAYSSLVVYGPVTDWESAQESEVGPGVILRRLNSDQMAARFSHGVKGHQLIDI
ncbi:hypothetical protein FA15DRAFT_673081 [Coprinopsis marcescibilis]|uniref:F-box domain-containing protein n=1 Tax=Coprinopsis marcescibilis TaxID=230819 RepID=A0A5C3KKX0_COPMA|nr:hypothetical protein FA15DRAFT_673081 [Coprinopsis marcescibilis]